VTVVDVPREDLREGDVLVIGAPGASVPVEPIRDVDPTGRHAWGAETGIRYVFEDHMVTVDRA